MEKQWQVCRTCDRCVATRDNGLAVCALDFPDTPPEESGMTEFVRVADAGDRDFNLSLLTRTYVPDGCPRRAEHFTVGKLREL